VAKSLAATSGLWFRVRGTATAAWKAQPTQHLHNYGGLPKRRKAGWTQKVSNLRQQAWRGCGPNRFVRRFECVFRQ